MTPQMVVLLLVVGACSAAIVSPYGSRLNDDYYQDNPHFYQAAAGLGGVGIGHGGLGGVGIGHGGLGGVGLGGYGLGIGGIGHGGLGLGGVGIGAIRGPAGVLVGGRGPLGGSFIAGRRFPGGMY